MFPFEEWSNYVHSYISGTYGVNAATPLWAGTEALIPGGQCGQPLRNEIERLHISYNAAKLLDRITLGFSPSIPFNRYL